MKGKVGRNDPCPCGSGKKLRLAVIPAFRDKRCKAAEVAFAKGMASPQAASTS